MAPEKLRRKAFNIAELRLLARRNVPKMLFDFVDGGAEDEISWARNVSDFDQLELLPRMLRATSQRNQQVELFGATLSLPVLIPPTGMSGMLWPYGELEVARACAAAGTIMGVSHASTCSLEDIAATGAGPKWYQVFPYKDRGMTQSLAERAQAAGYKALILTVDCQTHGQRERDLRNGFTVPPRVTLKNGLDTVLKWGWLWRMRKTPTLRFANYEPYFKDSGIVGLASYMGSMIPPDADWAYFDWLRSIWPGPLLIKGILHPDDAREALARGADGIFVSNHGGRQLDGTLSSIAALAPVADAVGGQLKILLDGGIRRGTDVLKTLALGADAVCIGRPHLWGLAAAGQDGVARALEILRQEIERAMILGGWDSLAEIDASVVRLHAVTLPRQSQQAEEPPLAAVR